MSHRMTVDVEVPDDQVDALVGEVYRLVFKKMIDDSPVLNPHGGWLDTRAAAEYAGCTVGALHKATAAREVRFEQSSTGGKCWFRREWLDDWRAGVRPNAG